MNIYNKLLGLLPKTPTDVGTVVSVYTDGLLVELQRGGYVRVTGVANLGDRVFIKAGASLGLAPTLIGVTIEV